ncbi:MAG: glycine cleavage T C-terminal barrel domain-containing protein [Bdellovibrionota bacterium]
MENLAYTNICMIDLFNTQAYIARTGYTGEKGFELYVPNQIAVKCWQTLLADKENTGIKPIGLGARDTLRLEACYLLYGNDMDDSVSPLEAGISWATKLQKDQFIGKSPLIEQKELGVPRSIYAFKLEEKGIARHGMEVYFSQEKIGVVTSGSILPTLGGAGGMALLTSNKVKTGDKIEIDIRGKRKTATIMKRPLYSAKTKD